jgi:hypothetical protein
MSALIENERRLRSRSEVPLSANSVEKLQYLDFKKFRQKHTFTETH